MSIKNFHALKPAMDVADSLIGPGCDSKHLILGAQDVGPFATVKATKENHENLVKEVHNLILRERVVAQSAALKCLNEIIMPGNAVENVDASFASQELFELAQAIDRRVDADNHHHKFTSEMAQSDRDGLLAIVWGLVTVAWTLSCVLIGMRHSDLAIGLGCTVGAIPLGICLSKLCDLKGLTLSLV